VTYLFTLCEYGGGETASCEVVCDEAFADGFERGLHLRLNQDTHYVVREEIDDESLAGRIAELGPWIDAARL